MGSIAITFPTTLDALTNPIGTDSTVTVSHSLQHANLNDAVEALEAKVGINASAVTSSLDYKVAQNTTGLSGHINQTVAHGATGAVVGTTNVQTLTGKTMDYLVAAGNVATNLPPSALSGLTADGLAVRISSTAFVNRTLTGGSTRVTVTNGNGVAGNPTVDVPAAPLGQSTADQPVTSSVVTVDATNLVVTLLASRTYRISANLGFTGAAAGDARTSWAVTGTAASVGPRLCMGPSIGSTDVIGTAAASVSVGPTRASRHQLVTEISYGTDGTNESAVYEEFIAVGGASGGTVQLKFAQGTSNATATNLRSGSYVLALVVS